MTQHQTFEAIGHNPEQDDNGAPALRKRISEVVKEYDIKAAALPDALRSFNEGETALRVSTSIGGAFGGQLFRRDPNIYQRDAEACLLRSAWRHIYDGLHIDKIASAKDRKRLSLLMEQPPAFTIEALREVFGSYLLDPRHQVLKGLAECFCDLDPAYKSHSKVKIGVSGLPKRIIIENVGGWYSYGKDRLQDTLNALRLYRGEARYEHGAFQDMLAEAKRDGEADFNGGILRLYKNGNGHLIFDKEGLADINRALAEFYGDVLPDVTPDGVTPKPGTALAKNLQFYPTPKAVAQELIGALELRGDETIFEPSCGEGHLIEALQKWVRDPNLEGRVTSLKVTGIECDHNRAETARAKGFPVLQANFLEVTPDARFDAVLMNPPFYGRHYKKHLDHAMKFVKPGGRLVCILPATAHYDHETTIGQWRDLPVGSFAESGTNIPTGYCVWWKPKAEEAA